MARAARKAALFVSVLLAVSFFVAAAQPASQSFPSQVEPSVAQPGSGFYFPYQLPLFLDLETRAVEVLQNVSTSNFSDANASLANYSTVVNGFYTWENSSTAKNHNETGAGNLTVLSAMTASQTVYSQLINKSKRYEGLYAASIQGANSSNTSQSAQNAVAMEGLNADIKTLRDQINATNDVIFSPPVDQAGLDMSDYARVQGTFDTYVTLLDSQLTNVTSVAFQNTTATIALNHSIARYADYVQVRGTVNGNTTGVSNGTVVIMLGARSIGAAQTNATGAYTYDYFVDGVTPGRYAIYASYDPLDQPYKASNSSNATLLVQNVSATNVLHASAGSLFGNGVSFTGTVATDREPVSNASVALYVDGTVATYAETDANGTYEMNYGLTLPDYLGSLFQPSGATFYTVFQPAGHPLGEARSDSIVEPLLGTHVAAFFGSFTGVAAAATVLLAAAIIVYFGVSRTIARRTTVAETAAPEAEVRAPAELMDVGPAGLESRVEIEQETRYGVQDVMGRTREFYKAGDRNGAIIAAYRGALILITQPRSIALKSSLSHWEVFAIIEERLQDAQAFRELTQLYELASYSGREMTDTHVEAAFKDLTVIGGRAQDTGDET